MSTPYFDLRNCDIRVLTHKESEAIATVLVAERSLPDSILWNLFKKNTVANLIANTLETKTYAGFGFYATRGLFNVLAILCPTPEVAYIWAYQLFVVRAELGRPVDVEDLFTQHFSNGIPTKEAYAECWEAQKRKGISQLCFLAKWPN